MRISETWKRILSVTLIIAFVVAGMAILGHLLRPVNFSTYFNHDMEEIRRSGSGVDMIFIGASRGQKAFIPSVFEEELGLGTVVNATSSAQTIAGGYYRLKELLAEFSPKYVVLDLSTKSLLDKHDPVQSILVASDSMNVFDRIGIITRELQPGDWLYLFDAYRFRDNLLKIPELAEERAAVVARGYRANAETDSDYYADTGWVRSTRGNEQGNIPLELNKNKFRVKKLADDRIAYLDGIREMCEAKGATLILLSAPNSMMYLYSDAGYQEATDYYTAYATEHGIPYFNLNLLRDREKLLPDTVMKDEKHVIDTGAQIVSEKLCEILNAWQAGEDTSVFFYGNYQEMFADTRRVAGLSVKVKKDPDEKLLIHVTVESVQNPDVTPVYRVRLTQDNWETEQLLADWTTETQMDLTVPKRSKYLLRVEAATGPDDPEPAWQEIKK